ncbi:hypothetical protein [Phenylobacterium sp.]|uniref:hypothetical protein n=1 Tax=Phenylobacterium sp. TaxID=1871053 RepID=UPI00391A4553
MSPSFLAERVAMAATPVFAAMALLAAADAGPAAMLCGGAAPWTAGGMATMYLLMSVFHAGPWLKRLGRRAVSHGRGE